MFKLKPQLYDIYITEKGIIHGLEEETISINRIDEQRYMDLTTMNDFHLETYFKTETKRIYDKLKQLEQNNKHVIALEDFKELQLHPKYDFEFLLQFCAVHRVLICLSHFEMTTVPSCH